MPGGLASELAHQRLQALFDRSHAALDGGDLLVGVDVLDVLPEVLDLVLAADRVDLPLEIGDLPARALLVGAQSGLGVGEPARQVALVPLGLQLADRVLVLLDVPVDQLPEIRARRQARSLEAPDRALVAADLAVQAALLAQDGSDPALQAPFLALDGADASLERADLALDRADLTLEAADVPLDLADLAVGRDRLEGCLQPGAGVVVHGLRAAVHVPLILQRALILGDQHLLRAPRRREGLDQHRAAARQVADRARRLVEDHVAVDTRAKPAAISEVMLKVEAVVVEHRVDGAGDSDRHLLRALDRTRGSHDLCNGGRRRRRRAL